MPEKKPDPRARLGVCYYPEHWEETRWPEDLRRMRGLGIKFGRVAEFAWSRFEPEPARAHRRTGARADGEGPRNDRARLVKTGDLLGAFVASHDGATPVLSSEIIEQFKGLSTTSE